ncbi:MAG: hypothetical protein ABR589_12150 [Chthoniobacterales bacterium]
MTLPSASGSIAGVKLLLLFWALVASVACTTLENRRDLYRSPAEGYERWYRRPPPTRKPAGPPAAPATSTTTTTERHGVLTFPEESLPEGRE